MRSPPCFATSSPTASSAMASSAPIAAPNRQANFEFVLLPLIHTGDVINRVLGAITAIEPPFWFGAEPLLRQEIVELNLHRPDGHPSLPPSAGEVISIGSRRFRVLEGGLGGE